MLGYVTSLICFQHMRIYYVIKKLKVTRYKEKCICFHKIFLVTIFILLQSYVVLHQHPQLKKKCHTLIANFLLVKYNKHLTLKSYLLIISQIKSYKNCFHVFKEFRLIQWFSVCLKNGVRLKIRHRESPCI